MALALVPKRVKKEQKKEKIKNCARRTMLGERKRERGVHISYKWEEDTKNGGGNSKEKFWRDKNTKQRRAKGNNYLQ